MSTDRKRLNKAIQRIAREDPEIRKLLDDFRNSGGKPSESATSGSGAEDRQICCDGGTSGSTNPGSDTRDTGDGGKDGTDLGSDPADLGDMGGGSLVGVTDCATGTPIKFDGGACIPPPGWDDCNTPGAEYDYEEGFFWRVWPLGKENSGASYSGKTLNEAIQNSYTIYSPICVDGHITGYTGGDTATFRLVRCDGDVIETLGDGEKRACAQGDTSGPCSTGAPTAIPEWPENGMVDLYIAGGKIVGSKFDPENDGSYSKPMDSIELCDDFGNSFELAPSASGGWKSISSQNPDDGYLYNSSGEQIARISGSEYADPNV